MCSGRTRSTASAGLSAMCSSWFMATARRTAAAPVRFPTRVWRIQSLSCSMVNSMSIMSR